MNETPIPKTFHQIWMGKTTPRTLTDSRIDSFYRKWHDSWLLKNPGWEFKIWDDERVKWFTFRKPRLKRLLESCKSFSEKSDLLRFHLLYRFGGVYIDTDFECLRNIDSFVQGKSFVVCKETPRKLCAAFLASTPQHPNLKKLIDLSWDRDRSLTADWKYGPWFVTQHLGLEAGEEDGIDSDVKRVYPYGYQEMWRCHEDFSKTHPEAYAAHHWMFSWSDKGKHTGQEKFWY